MTTNTQNPKGGDTLIGQVVQGHYRILERVAKGGMAWIYRAEHTQLRNDLAIKILFPQLLEEPELCERFLEEARIQFALKHPNIVQVTDVISEAGLVGIVLEWINGRDLRYWLREHRKPFSAIQIREVMLPVVDAIHYAHQKGIVHRDLKPGNILFHHENDRVIAKVADFGIAKLMDEVDSQTKTGTMMGTLQYMSPEQIRDSKYVDQRSDIYSLGIILFRMATGRLPFRDKNALSLMRKHETVAPPVPSQLNPAIPDELEALILRCLEKEPDDRFPDCAALGDALDMLPEASFRSRQGIFPEYLIGQPAGDDFGDPNQTAPHGVKRISFGSGDELPTGSLAVSNPSAIKHFGAGAVANRAARLRPPGASSPGRGRESETVIEHGSRDAFASAVEGAPIAPDTPVPKRPMPTALDAELPDNVKAYLDAEAKDQTPDPARPLDLMGESPLAEASAELVSTSSPEAPKRRGWLLPVIILGALLCTAVGAYFYWSQRTVQPKKNIIVTPKPPPRPRGPSMIEKLDKAVASALRSIQLQKLAEASDKLKFAMKLKTKKGKAPAWRKSKYFPELFRVAGNVARGRGQLYTATRYFEKYGSADMSGKSKAKIALHKEKTRKLKKSVLPQLKAELKTRVGKANSLLGSLQKRLKGNRFDRAFSLYQTLRKTVSSVPTVYQKLAQTLRQFFPALSMSIYKSILDDMLPPDALAAQIRREKDDLQKEIDKRQETIQEEFTKASTLAKSGKYRQLNRWLRKQYRNNQSFGLFHKQMVRLLMDLVTRDFGRAEQLLGTYMKLFKRYTEKGLVKWAKTSKTPLELPNYDKLKKMREMLKRWRRFSRVINGVSNAIRQQAMGLAARRLRGLPKGWREWIKEDQWGFHKYIALGASLTSSHRALVIGLKRHTAHQKSLNQGYTDKAKAGFDQLNGYLIRNTGGLRPLIGARALKRWRAAVSRQLKRGQRAEALLKSAKSHYWRKRWKQSEVAFGRYIKFLPQTHLLKWAKKQIHKCQCNRNVPWVWCKKKKRKR